MQLVVSRWKQAIQKVAHRREEQEEKQNKVGRKYHQEIRGGILKNLVEETRRTESADTSSSSPFHRKRDEEERREIFDPEVIGCCDAGTKTRRTERTVHQRKHGIYDLPCSPPNEGTEVELIQRKSGDFRSF